MSVQFEDFVNPKSMLTPGGATAIVAILSGIIFSATGLHVHILLAVFSLFFAAVVFFSKEFSDPTMSKPAKGFFYLVNALIIFAMSTGTHATFDKRPNSAQPPSTLIPASLNGGNGTLMPNLLDIFMSSAMAQAADANVPVLTQQRPLFFDWTQTEQNWKLPGNSMKSPVMVSKTDRSSTIRKALADAGLSTSNFHVGLEFDKSALPSGTEVKTVQWSFPQTYFVNNKKIISNPEHRYGLAVNAWKSFPVLATVELTNGEKLNFYEFIDLKDIVTDKK